nr:ABC transporter ATP-binding protein [uncultured Oscillibacter sp.]
MELIRMEQISKVYQDTVALDHVDFHLNEGEILSILGENGAGKTTLMKILYGMTPATEGSIFYHGKPLQLKRPLDAIDKGICMVHQHFMLIPVFSVTDNIIAGAEPHKNIFLDRARARQEVRDLIAQFHFNMDPDIQVEHLSVGEQQRVEILKALYRKANVIILDEPTAVLTPSEVDELFAILRRLRDNGKSIIIITHKLRETIALADRVMVLRSGKLVADDVSPKGATPEQLSNLMVGRQVDLNVRRPAKHIGEVCLHVEGLTMMDGKKAKLKNISLDVHKGEILGIAGVEGNGQSQLLEALTGLSQPEAMTLTLDGQPVHGACDVFLDRGVGHVPEDRLAMGLVKEMSVKDNLILGYHGQKQFCGKGGLMKNAAIDSYAERLKKEFLIKAPTVDASVASLSGGNQQKVIIARVFSQEPKALIVAHPTRGVDIGAMEYIHQQLIDIRDSGAAVLLISADLDEVRTLSDRILVLYEGEIVSESLPGELNETELGLLMTGSRRDKKEGYILS